MTGRQETTDELVAADNFFYIKGPMGKGLQLEPTGVHVAFCAGTGALVFIDLVAALLMKHCMADKKTPDGLNFFETGFVLHLYCSFQDEETAIGLDLIRMLEKVTNGVGFKATIRLSNPGEGKPKMPRWTDDFIVDQFKDIDHDSVKRVWVVGPPVMNQQFDITLAKMGLAKDKIEVM